MNRIRRMPLIAAALLLSSIASARPNALTTGCDTQEFLKYGESGCGEVVRNDEQCTPDGKECTCVNEGTAKDFALCAFYLIAACEDLGCTWVQADNGDVTLAGR